MREASRGRRGRAGSVQKVVAAEPLPPLARARAIALRALAVRARTEAQLRARLAREDLSDQADEVMVWLRGLGYLDDDAYALAHARGLLAPGKLGPLKVERRLVQAGLPAARARAVIRQVLGGEEGRAPAAAERELCRTLAERRARRPLGESRRPRASAAGALPGRPRLRRRRGRGRAGPVRGWRGVGIRRLHAGRPSAIFAPPCAGPSSPSPRSARSRLATPGTRASPVRSSSVPPRRTTTTVEWRS